MIQRLININDLVTLIKEIKSIPKENDIRFILPDEVFKAKIGNCVDIALAIRSFCLKHNIDYSIARVGFNYNEKSSQHHVICCLFIKNKWIIIQESFAEEIGYVFQGNNDLNETIKNFALIYLPYLIKLFNNVKKSYYEIVDKTEDIKFNVLNEINNVKLLNKQQFIYDMFKNITKHYININ